MKTVRNWQTRSLNFFRSSSVHIWTLRARSVAQVSTRGLLWLALALAPIQAHAEELHRYRVTIYYPDGQQLRTYVEARTQSDTEKLAHLQFPNLRIGVNKVDRATQ